MTDRSHDSAYPYQFRGGARREFSDENFLAELAQTAAPDEGPLQQRRRAAAARRIARRRWVVKVGQAPATLAAWRSRAGWLADLRAWAEGAEGSAVLARRHVSAALFLAVATALASYADSRTGRHCAVTNARVARDAGCSERSVSTVRTVLSGAQLAIEVVRGHGSVDTPAAGCRPSVWHLLSRRAPVDNAGGGGAVCDLPPTRRVRGVSHPGKDSPSRACARQGKFKNRSKDRPARPLSLQKLAAELVTPAGRSQPLCYGLDRGHIGAICDALALAGIDPAVWSATQIRDALNADMRTSGWSWPDRIQRPAGFLLTRLRRLPARPAVTASKRCVEADKGRPTLVVAVPSVGASHEAARALTQRWYADVMAVTSTQDRRMVLDAHRVKFGGLVDPVAALAGAGRRAARLFPALSLAEGLTRWAREVLGDERRDAAAAGMSRSSCVPLSTELLIDQAINDGDCVVCGAPHAPVRPQLPLRAMSMVCDKCWPAISAELTEAGGSDYEAGVGVA